MDILIGILEQGMIYAIMALGVYITYKILDFPDLTVDGSFPLGAAITVMLMTKTDSNFIATLTLGHNPYIIMLFAFISGGIAGLVTGIIHVKFQVRDLLSGIITMTALYSINLHIAGKANLPIFNMDTIFSNKVIDSIYPEIFAKYKVLIIISIVTIGAKIFMDLYLQTRSGYLLRAVGNNPVVVTSLAKDSGSVKILGLVIANALVALSGSVMSQQQGFFEISMGTGAVVIGLATVIIGTNLFRKISFVKSTTAVIIGSILYKLCISLAMDVSLGVIVAVVVAVLSIVYVNKDRYLKIIMTIIASVTSYFLCKILIPYDISASDMKLVTSVFFLLILIIGREQKRRGSSVGA
ncbi:MAG TPA: ABC transporter permease [Epulopiscium sp.]|nr:ABC transporter permease [Candidatus Epulonipiscium sp.]